MKKQEIKIANMKIKIKIAIYLLSYFLVRQLDIFFKIAIA